MKKITSVILLFLFVNLLSAQTGSFDKRLLSKFSEKELQELKTNNPDSYAYWNFLVANSYSVMDLPAAKANDKEIKGSVKIADLNNVNILDLKLFPVNNQNQYYRIEGTSKMLMILSDEQVRAKYKASTTK